MAEHTPGPWKVGSKARMKPYVEGADGMFVASCGGNAPGKGNYDTATWRRREANARLIAAAPDLLEALKRLLSRLAEFEADANMDAQTFREWAGHVEPAVRNALAAIAKATSDEM